MRNRMQAHALDAFSLVAGAVFAVLGVLVAVDSATDLDPRWFIAVLLVGLGLAGVLGSLDWSRDAATTDDEGPDPSGPRHPPTPAPPEEDTRP